jgi:RsiG-like
LDLATFERISEPDYLQGLTDRPLADLRTMRAECRELEDALSFLRRLVQGHLDIVGFEQDRRASGQPADLAALVAALPKTLSGHVVGHGGGRLRVLASPADPTITDELDAICDAVRLAHVPDLSDDELAVLVTDLQCLERLVSARRKILFGRLDVLSAEVTRRYRTGAASVDALLVDEAGSHRLRGQAESPAVEER